MLGGSNLGNIFVDLYLEGNWEAVVGKLGNRIGAVQLRRHRQYCGKKGNPRKVPLLTECDRPGWESHPEKGAEYRKDACYSLFLLKDATTEVLIFS